MGVNEKWIADGVLSVFIFPYTENLRVETEKVAKDKTWTLLHVVKAGYEVLWERKDMCYIIKKKKSS